MGINWTAGGSAAWAPGRRAALVHPDSGPGTSDTGRPTGWCGRSTGRSGTPTRCAIGSRTGHCRGPERPAARLLLYRSRLMPCLVPTVGLIRAPRSPPTPATAAAARPARERLVTPRREDAVAGGVRVGDHHVNPHVRGCRPPGVIDVHEPLVADLACCKPSLPERYPGRRLRPHLVPRGRRRRPGRWSSCTTNTVGGDGGVTFVSGWWSAARRGLDGSDRHARPADHRCGLRGVDDAVKPGVECAAGPG
jgi:hypothetical protein